MHVVKALAQVPQDGLGVAALGQDVQQVGRSHKVEAREGNALGLQVVLRLRRETQFAQSAPAAGTACITHAGWQAGRHAAAS